MNLHIFEIRGGEYEHTEFMLTPAEIDNAEEAISYMYGEEILKNYADEYKGTNFYWWGDFMVGHYKCFVGLTSNEIEVLQKFWVI